MVCNTITQPATEAGAGGLKVWASKAMEGHPRISGVRTDEDECLRMGEDL